MRRWVALIGFLVLTVGGGLAIGSLTVPGEWYAALAKPAFNPPNWLFGPVWAVLYVVIAIVGWRTFQRDRAGWPMRLWWIQLGLNFLWSPTFFAAHQIAAALVIVLMLLAAILAFVTMSWPRDRPAAYLFMPYAAWVAFASLLNGAVWLMN